MLVKGATDDFPRRIYLKLGTYQVFPSIFINCVRDILLVYLAYDLSTLHIMISYHQHTVTIYSGSLIWEGNNDVDDDGDRDVDGYYNNDDLWYDDEHDEDAMSMIPWWRGYDHSNDHAIYHDTITYDFATSSSSSWVIIIGELWRSIYTFRQKLWPIFFKHKDQHDIFLNFVWHSVYILSLYYWSFTVNLTQIAFTVFMWLNPKFEKIEIFDIEK